VFFSAGSADFPTTDFATHDLRNGHRVLDFDDATDESAIWTGLLPSGYGGGGLVVKVFWMAASTSGTVQWDASFERMNTDLDADSFASVSSATGTANGTSGITTTTSITLADGAAIDSIAAGEVYRCKITRDVSVGSNMTGDAELLGISILEA
jgi:hypothetical protein